MHSQNLPWGPKDMARLKSTEQRIRKQGSEYSFHPFSHRELLFGLSLLPLCHQMPYCFTHGCRRPGGGGKRPGSKPLRE